MNKEISLRQIAFMYIFLSLSPILRQIPSSLAGEAGRSGYLSPLWSVIAIIPLTGVILLLIKAFPGLNIYEIIHQLLGKFLAKVFIFFYMLWFVLLLAVKVNAYSLTLQFTLMPKTRSNLLMVVMIILVYYALLQGIKTIFRFSELTLAPILFIFAVLFLCALSKLRIEYLLPVSTFKLPSTMAASKDVIAVGGNIIIAVFFADKFDIHVTKEQKRKLWYGVLVFTLLAFIITIFTFGISGADYTAGLPFSFYITVKSISFFNVFERFEVLVTLVCVLSDFVTISVLSILLVRSIKWLFGIKDNKILYIPITMVIYYLTYFVSSTQFEYDYLYRNIIVNLNLIFQYLIPLFLGMICLAKRKEIKKQL